MSDERPVGQPTLDRRIERLEREFAKFETDVALMKAEQGHLRELVTKEFSANATTTARIEGTLSAVSTLIQTTSTDAAASPLGRALGGDIAAVDAKADRALAIAERVDRRVLLATGAIGVIAWVAGIGGPVVARAVFGS